MNKKNKRDALENTAKCQLQKTYQIAESGLVKDLLITRKNKALKDNVIFRDKIIKDRQKPPTKLLELMEEQQNFLDDLIVEVSGKTVELSASDLKLQQAIAELRKVDPIAADQLEQSIIIKKDLYKSGVIAKKRL
jgi:hypothetical protein